MATCMTDKHKDNKNIEVTKFDGKNLRIDHDALRRILFRPKLQDKKFSLISIAGKMRTGKSFLMNFVLRYLRRRGWENKEWMGDDNFVVDSDEIPFAGGTERCTTGIRLFDEIFEVPISRKETMMVMLMDTQGLFDNDTPEVVNKTLLTLTTLMSSVQIFNSKENIDTQSMEYLKTCVDFALRTARVSATERERSGIYMKPQDLMFLVRDFPEEDEESFGLEIGNKYLQKILNSDKGGDKLRKIRAGIRKSFDKVECFTMPCPDRKVTKKTFQGRNGDLGEEFRRYIKEFVEHIASSQNLVPKQSNEKALTSMEMFDMIAECDTFFAERMIDAHRNAKMNERTYYSSVHQEAVATYKHIMKESILTGDGIKELENKHANYKEIAMERLELAEFVGEEDTYDWKKHFLRLFITQCDDHFVDTVREYERMQQQSNDRKLETAKALLEYEGRMKIAMLFPLSDEEFEVRHAMHLNAVAEKYSSSTDLDTLLNNIIGIYEDLKEENQRETAQNRRNSSFQSSVLLNLLHPDS